MILFSRMRGDVQPFLYRFILTMKLAVFLAISLVLQVRAEAKPSLSTNLIHHSYQFDSHREDIEDMAVINKRYDSKSIESSVKVNTEQQEVIGKITNEEGKPISGVTITVSGTSIGVTSNENGDYRISIPAAGMMLSFTRATWAASGRCSASATSCWRRAD